MNEVLFKVEETEDLFTATCHNPRITAEAKSLAELIAILRQVIDSRVKPDDSTPDDSRN
jgi:hypothetical protein